MSETRTGQHGVIVTLPEIYAQLQATDDKLDRLATSVEQMVSINQRLDQHHARANVHGERLRKVESQVAAQWIIVGIVVTVIGASVVSALVK